MCLIGSPVPLQRLNFGGANELGSPPIATIMKEG